MKYIMKTVVGGTLVLSFVLSATPAFAQEATTQASTTVQSSTTVAVAVDPDITKINNRIAELQRINMELRAKVVAKTITKEQAQEEWKKLIAELRVAKKAIFDKRRAVLEARVEKFAEKNPERATIVKERIEANEKRRSEMMEERAMIKAKVESGEITKEEAVKLRKVKQSEEKAKMQTFRAEQKAKIEVIKTNRQEARQNERGGERGPRMMPPRPMMRNASSTQ